MKSPGFVTYSYLIIYLTHAHFLNSKLFYLSLSYLSLVYFMRVINKFQNFHPLKFKLTVNSSRCDDISGRNCSDLWLSSMSQVCGGSGISRVALEAQTAAVLKETAVFTKGFKTQCCVTAGHMTVSY